MEDRQPSIDIIYEDDELIAINKPHGLLVHKSKIASDVKVFALQLLRDKLNQRVYLTHRLDRKTSGVLLFTKSKVSNSYIQQLFRERKIKKTYKAIVRGFMDDNGIIDYPLQDGNVKRDAKTNYYILDRYEVPWPSGKFPTSRYSLVELSPEGGRHHQIRKHLAHVFHPILGDRPHGCNKQNRMWKEKYGMTTMMLHAESIDFKSKNGDNISITAPLSKSFNQVLKILENS